MSLHYSFISYSLCCPQHNKFMMQSCECHCNLALVKHWLIDPHHVATLHIMHTVTEQRFALKILPTSERLFYTYTDSQHCCTQQSEVRTYRFFSEVTDNGFEPLFCKMIKAFVVAFFFFRDWYCSSNTLQHFPSNRQPLNINNRNMVLLGLTVQSQLHNITATPHFRVPTWQI